MLHQVTFSHCTRDNVVQSCREMLDRVTLKMSWWWGWPALQQMCRTHHQRRRERFVCCSSLRLAWRVRLCKSSPTENQLLRFLLHNILCYLLINPQPSPSQGQPVQQLSHHQESDPASASSEPTPLTPPHDRPISTAEQDERQWGHNDGGGWNQVLL